ncbi:MAG: L,D-transpeptidase family protein [Polyangiales bacterium]
MAAEEKPRKKRSKAKAPRPSYAWPILALLAGMGGAYVVLGACGKAGEPPQPTRGAQSAVAPGAAGEPNLEGAGKGLIDPSDGGGNNLIAIPPDAFLDNPDSALPQNAVLLGAAHFMTHVWEKPDYSSNRIGYLRAGAKVAIKDSTPGEAVKRIRTTSCKEGWVAIQPRGYVCLDKGGGSLNLEAPNVRLATAPPNFDELLPYKYGFAWRMGSPLYRRVPTPKEWMEKEPWTKPAPKVEKKKKSDDDDDPYHDTITESDLLDGGVAKAVSKSQGDLLDGGPMGDQAEDAAVPWWLNPDAGKGSISLKDTVEGEGLVARRMAKGFAISIDRTFAWNNRMWHRTTMGLVAPADAVTIVKPPEFKGVELTGDMQLPLAWSLIKEAGIYESKDKKIFGIVSRFKKQTPIRLLASTAPGYEELKTGGFTYIPTFDGKWVRANEVNKAEQVAPPADLKPGEKWIDVSVKQETLVAYEGDKPVFATLISAGKDGTNVKGDFATVQGSFRIREKHVAATMDGDTSGELYSIDDVPYIEYFHSSYALHGAFWHSEFGRVRSHGRVNLSPADAKRVFMWTEPQLPTGWHAVWASESNPGTRVITRP